MKTETTTTKRKKVIVISWDNSEEQAFFDIVAVREGDDDNVDAIRSTNLLRPYAYIVDVLDVPALNKMLNAIWHAKSEEHLPFAESVRELTREQCLELLPTNDGAIRDEFSTATLRELVRSGLENDTISEDLIPS